MADAAAYRCLASGTMPAPDIWLLCYHWLIGSRETTLVTPGKREEWPGNENYQHIWSGLKLQSGPQSATGSHELPSAGGWRRGLQNRLKQARYGDAQCQIVSQSPNRKESWRGRVANYLISSILLPDWETTRSGSWQNLLHRFITRRRKHVLEALLMVFRFSRSYGFGI